MPEKLLDLWEVVVHMSGDGEYTSTRTSRDDATEDIFNATHMAAAVAQVTIDLIQEGYIVDGVVCSDEYEAAYIRPLTPEQRADYPMTQNNQELASVHIYTLDAGTPEERHHVTMMYHCGELDDEAHMEDGPIKAKSHGAAIAHVICVIDEKGYEMDPTKEDSSNSETQTHIYVRQKSPKPITMKDYEGYEGQCTNVQPAKVEPRWGKWGEDGTMETLRVLSNGKQYRIVVSKIAPSKQSVVEVYREVPVVGHTVAATMCCASDDATAACTQAIALAAVVALCDATEGTE